MDVKQERIAEGDTDDGHCVCNAEERHPVVDIQSQESMQGNDQIAAVPAAHADGERNQHALNWTQSAPPGCELNSHPQGQHCANGVTDEL